MTIHTQLLSFRTTDNETLHGLLLHSGAKARPISLAASSMG